MFVLLLLLEHWLSNLLSWVTSKMETEEFGSLDTLRPHFDALSRVAYFKIVLRTVSPMKRRLHNAYRILIWFLVILYNLQHFIRVFQVSYSKAAYPPEMCEGAERWKLYHSTIVSLHFPSIDQHSSSGNGLAKRGICNFVHTKKASFFSKDASEECLRGCRHCSTASLRILVPLSVLTSLLDTQPRLIPRTSVLRRRPALLPIM